MGFIDASQIDPDPAPSQGAAQGPAPGGGRFIDPSQFDDAPTPSLSISDALSNWGKSFAEGTTGLIGSGATMMDPVPSMMQGGILNKWLGIPSIAQTLGVPDKPTAAQKIEDARSAIIGDPDYSKASTAQRYTGAALQALPWAAGGGLPAAFDTAMSGVGSEVAKDNGVNPIIGALMAGSARGLSTGAVESVADRYATKLENASESTLQKGLGVQYGDRVKGLNRVNLFLDDEGNAVPFDKVDEAASIQAPIQKQIETLKDNGIFDGAPNSAEGLKIHLESKAQDVGVQISSLSKEADAAIGAQNIEPDLTATDKFVNSYRPEIQSKLQDKLDNILEDYKAEPGTGFSKLTNFLNKLQKETKFDTATAPEVTQLKRFVSYDLRTSAENAFDAALPEKAGQFANANDVYSSIKAIGKTLNKPLSKAAPSFGDFIKGGSLPMTALTGVLSAPFGLAPAAAISGTNLAGGALLKYLKAAYPISASNLLGSAAGAARSVEGLAGAAGVSSLANLSRVVGAQVPQLSSSGPPPASTVGASPQDRQQVAQLLSTSDSSIEKKDKTAIKGPFPRELEDQIDPIRSGAKGTRPQESQGQQDRLSDSTFRSSLPSPEETQALINKSRASARGPNAFIDRALDRAAAKQAGLPVEPAAGESALKPMYDAVQGQETGKRSDASTVTSSKGAVGLMQIEPDTAKGIAKELGLTKYDIKDPTTNRLMGEYYLASLMDKYDGDAKLALAAYDAGPTRVDNWLKLYGNNWDEISSSLKRKRMFSETTDYVPSVLRRMNA